MKGGSFALLTALLAGAALGQAASQVPLSIDLLVAKADAVVHGKVVRMTCQRDDEGRMFTKVHFQIIEQVKGRQRGGTLVVVQGGGVLGRRIARSPIEPTYRVGAEVVVFVMFNSRDEAATLGLNQGKFDVARQPKTGLADPFGPSGSQLPTAAIFAATTACRTGRVVGCRSPCCLTSTRWRCWPVASRRLVSRAFA